MDKFDFAKIMSAIHAAYPAERITGNEKSVQLWFEELKKTDYKVAAYALERHIRTNKFPPSIAEILNGAEQKNRFNNFLPRDYNFASLERALLMSDLEETKKLFSEAMK